jgi:hypothetical protein
MAHSASTASLYSAGGEIEETEVEREAEREADREEGVVEIGSSCSFESNFSV